MAGLLALLWILGLFVAAPVLRGEGSYPFISRLRDVLTLGVAIPFVLGFANVLYPVALWVVLAACIVVAWLRRPSAADDKGTVGWVPYLTIGVVALIAWPSLMRPILDGDSLSYHLPNAAAWVHGHGLWNAGTRYWWYPPASELFAAGLYAVSGPFALPWCGVGPLLLLGLRICRWACDLGAPRRLAPLLAAAVVTALPLTLQAATLQNDVWLAAFFLETLWSAQRQQWNLAARSAAVTTLLKPDGFIFAFLAAFVSRANLRVWLVAAGAFGLWALHDALLWKSAIVPPATTSYGNDFKSTIIAHGLPALWLLATVAVRASPFVLITFLAALGGPLLLRNNRAIGWAACAAIVAYPFMPLAFSGPGPQLENGHSLRYATPAIALGALVLAPWLTRAPVVAAVLLGLSVVFGATQNVMLFANDLPTLIAPAFALILVGLIALARRIASPWPIAAGVAAAIIATSLLAARQPAAYYTDGLAYDGKKSGVYAWIAQTQPAAIGSSGLRLGTVNVLAPGARAIDLPDAATCATAQTHDVLLIAVSEPDRTPDFNAARLTSARSCGRVVYQDGIVVVVQPMNP